MRFLVLGFEGLDSLRDSCDLSFESGLGLPELFLDAERFCPGREEPLSVEGLAPSTFLEAAIRPLVPAGIPRSSNRWGELE